MTAARVSSGYRRFTAVLRRLGWSVNRKRVRRWMHELGLAGKTPKRTTRTTNSKHDFPRYDNLVKDPEVTRLDEVWAADMTYIRLQRDLVYLAVLMDVFTSCLRGWHLGRNLDHRLTLAALEQALQVATPHSRQCGASDKQETRLARSIPAARNWKQRSRPTCRRCGRSRNAWNINANDA